MTTTPDSRKGDLWYTGNGGDSFRKHDEQMRRFRSAHPKVEREVPKGERPGLNLIPLPLVQLGQYLQN